MFRVITATAVLAVMLAAADECTAATPSGVTIATVRNPKNALGTYDVTVTGTMSLAVGDAYNGSTAYLTKPDGTVVPMFLNVTPPAPGQSANYTATASGVAGMAGNWSVTVQMSYTSGGQSKTATTTFSPIMMP